MSKLWVFGDSYGVHIAQDPNSITPWFWAYELAKKLKCEKYENHCQMGVSNEYIHYMIKEHEDQIEKDDYVIVITTSILRKWFFEDRPFISNFYINNFNENVSREEFESVRRYVVHLNNPNLNNIYFENFLGWLHFKSITKNWNMIIIPGFEFEEFPISHKYTVNGSLIDVCSNEFYSEEDTKWFYDVYSKGRDARAGHLIKDNHKILCNKVYNTFINNDILDLKNGFFKKVIKKDKQNFLEDQVPKLDLSNTHVKGFIPKI